MACATKSLSPPAAPPLSSPRLAAVRYPGAGCRPRRGGPPAARGSARPPRLAAGPPGRRRRGNPATSESGPTLGAAGSVSVMHGNPGARTGGHRPAYRRVAPRRPNLNPASAGSVSSESGRPLSMLGGFQLQVLGLQCSQSRWRLEPPKERPNRNTGESDGTQLALRPFLALPTGTEPPA